MDVYKNIVLLIARSTRNCLALFLSLMSERTTDSSFMVTLFNKISAQSVIEINWGVVAC
eukprot:m.1640978 g.1640978  ORF g.1640978 m.1640978 type:complete len:59 (-) comp44856_c0_seq1:24-200(-)